MSRKVPWLPVSALIFYIIIVLLWQVGIVPSPNTILQLLEELYQSYGLVGLFIASFLEGIVYLGLYFPGSFVVALAVILSDGSFISLITISAVVALALTVTAMINYSLGRKIISNKLSDKITKESNRVASKGLLASMLHPNLLAFYFFNSGIKRHNFLKTAFVPIIMIPYGLALGYLFYLLKRPLRSTLESPYIMISFILLWILFAVIINRNRK